MKRIMLVLAAACLVAFGCWVLFSLHPGLPGGTASVLSGTARAAEPGKPPTSVVRICMQGGVVTSDGQVWVYRPDLDKWMTLDEAFRNEGKTTHVVPLPVGIDEIQDMETFGFILTRKGEIWLYEVEADRWRKLPHPA